MSLVAFVAFSEAPLNSMHKIHRIVKIVLTTRIFDRTTI